jgi:hypothetical protein
MTDAIFEAASLLEAIEGLNWSHKLALVLGFCSLVTFGLSAVFAANSAHWARKARLIRKEYQRDREAWRRGEI